MSDVDPLVAGLFRREAARLVARLTRTLGAAHLELAEEAVQDALIRALAVWPYRGVPDDPAVWLFTVARNRALDRLRQRSRAGTLEARLATELTDSAVAHSTTAGADERAHFAREVDDDALRMMFLCCHPALSRDARVALTLKLVCGFGVEEIARAFLATGTTIAQRLVRARRHIAALDGPFELAPADVPERLDSVLEVLYLVFNEGYAAFAGEDLVREDLVREALRLCGLVAGQSAGDRPGTHALLALMRFQAARLPARIDDAGELVLLPDQDRSRWDPALVAGAFSALERAAQGAEETPYHLQAAIAACHAVAQDDASTDWARILELYDRLFLQMPTPVVALNRAVAVVRVRGPEAGLAALDSIDGARALTRYALFHSARGDFLRRLGRNENAAEAYRTALSRPVNEPERRFLEHRLRALEG